MMIIMIQLGIKNKITKKFNILINYKYKNKTKAKLFKNLNQRLLIK